MSDDPNKVVTPAKLKKRFRILLGVSLALNLMVIGAVVGVISKGPGRQGGGPGMRETAFPYVGAFDRADKRAMRQEMRARLSYRSEARAAHQASYRAFLELLRAETFDAAAASSVMSAQFERAQRLQTIGRELSIQRISDMSVEKRAAYADRLEYRLDNPKKRGKRKDR
ncbi:MAG: periplasmic heavy metal sensor [Rhodobacteraceae bacterium]|jgi:uncharacterized membrane protein|uniref:periplasmic heavy metal sensor n=1 Tax=Planktotalea sp. TaxID=2029877 RepID=UPI000183A9A3|nr:periplasmic heavy metal sensor [Planktotalea sp.]EDZ41133.1 hypothetical protein RB2083_647 [Rhodobacteraceae bacterium HTCC2083]MBT5822570.1 periplasmic heavy metal sensor [Paracoccaceae bacterium]MDG1083660.1 periplasmic heavy metal sensor [Planktotalea sp.]